MARNLCRALPSLRPEWPQSPAHSCLHLQFVMYQMQLTHGRIEVHVDG
ncbi:TPA: hypothetical protein ACP37T_003559 [Pseudomonas aeruginosa]